MVNSVESVNFAPEQWQYWGGFFGEALRPTISREIRQPRETARNPVVRTYYKPRLAVFDRRREYVEYVQQNFGGSVREQPLRKSTPEEGDYNFPGDRGFLWRLANTPSILTLLQEIEPYIISQSELVKIMMEFLSAKQERVSEFQGSNNQISDAADKREEEEAEFSQLLTLARSNRHEVRGPLSSANLAGVLDASGAISITRSQRSRGNVEYGTRVEIHSDNNLLLGTLVEQYGKTTYPIRHGQPVVYSDKRFYLSIGRADDIRSVLESTLPHLNLQRRQAEIALGFLDVQQTLLGGSETKGWRARRGALAEVLEKHSNPSIDMVTMLREGFYSEMYRLNHE